MLFKPDLTELHVGYLYASPLIYEDYDSTTKKRGYQLPPQLTFRNEIQAIKKVLKNSKQNLIFKSSVATQSKFIEMIDKNPRILHISCHGIKNCVNSMGLNFEDMKDEGNFLLFESPTGEGELVSLKKLN